MKSFIVNIPGFQYLNFGAGQVGIEIVLINWKSNDYLTYVIDIETEQVTLAHT